jgi:hypothetical protein
LAPVQKANTRAGLAVKLVNQDVAAVKVVFSQDTAVKNAEAALCIRTMIVSVKRAY